MHCFFDLEFENSQFYHETGLHKHQFYRLLFELSLTPVVVEYSKSKESLAVLTYLVKLRTGETNVSLAIKFSVSCRTLSRRLKLARQLFANFVQQNVNHTLNRPQMISYSTVLSRSIFSPANLNVSVQIWDGTYIYMQKTANHRYQKYTYNSHKKRNYLKMMMCVLSGGYILATFGPFKATENDATLAKKILSDHGIFQNAQFGKSNLKNLCNDIFSFFFVFLFINV